MTPLVVILIVVAIMSIIWAFGAMEANSETGVGFAGGMFFIAILSLVITAAIDPYRDGQIDALSGKAAYELVQNEKGEMVWDNISYSKKLKAEADKKQQAIKDAFSEALKEYIAHQDSIASK